MKCKFLISAIALIVAADMPGIACGQGVITVVEDFEGEFPGQQAIWGGGYSFHGGGSGDPTVVEEVIATGGFNSLQAYQISIDATIDSGSWGWYYGLGSYMGFYGENYGLAAGQPGEDNPANFAVSFELKTAGNTNAAPIGGDVVLYKADYESVYGVDLNGDADMADGYDIWSSSFTVPAAANNYAGYNHVTWTLNQGTAPTAPAPITTPQFDDEATFVFRLYFNNGAFGIDADNVVTLDNVGVTFTPIAPLSGDFDDSGKVDGNDFLVWQRGGSPYGTTSGDLQTWQTNYGAPLAGTATSSIPEPASSALIAGALAVGAFLRGGRRSGRQNP